MKVKGQIIIRNYDVAKLNLRKLAKKKTKFYEEKIKFNFESELNYNC